jgi:hypothetical protein
MPKNKVNDPITDQEIAFAHLVLSGAMTDRQAAEAAGLNPDSAAYTKAKPRVRAYMLEHRAAVQQQLVQQEAEGRHRLNLDREQVLNRLWELANMGPEMTRGSITGQVKALSMIVAMENFIPDRHAAPPETTAPTPPAQPKVYVAAWLARKQATANEAQPGSGVPSDVPESELVPDSPAPPVPPARGAGHGASRAEPGHGESTFANPFTPSIALPSVPYVPMPASVPDTRVPFSITKNRFGRRRR